MEKQQRRVLFLGLVTEFHLVCFYHSQQTIQFKKPAAGKQCIDALETPNVHIMVVPEYGRLIHLNLLIRCRYGQACTRQ